MSFDQLQPELWLHIIDFLCPALPKSLSGWTKGEGIGEALEVIDRLPQDGAPGTTSRDDIRRPELVALMRTSVTMNHYASRSLYHRVITDNLGKVLQGSTSGPAHPQIQSKSLLLRQVRFLHLEYCQKTPREPSYTSLMTAGRAEWLLVSGLCQVASLDAAVDKGLCEIRNLCVWLLQITEQKSPFTQITRLSIGAIFGGQEGFWKEVEGRSVHDSPENQQIIDCQDSMVYAWQTRPLEHFCQRGSTGPLSFPGMFVWPGDDSGKSKQGHRPSFIFHFDFDTNLVPVGFPFRVRWVLEQYDNNQVINSVISRLTRCIHVSRELLRIHGSSLQDLLPTSITPILDLEIFASGCAIYDDRSPTGTVDAANPTMYGLSVEQERNFMLDWDRRTKRESKSAGLAEKITLLASADSPGCEGCGWDFEQRALEAPGRRDKYGQVRKDGDK